MRRFPVPARAFLALLALGCGEGGDSSSLKCDEADSTFALVQQVFENRGCTASTCHGADPGMAEAGLDLRPEGVYESLVNVDASSADLPLVFPADEKLSVLWLKVAAKTGEIDLATAEVSGSPMPSSSDQLTENEVELIRAWIRGGAPRTGVVAGTPESLRCGDLGDVQPNKVPPPPAPEMDEGVQFISGGWSLPAESEDEVCFVTYHDYGDRIPERFRLPCPEAYGGAARDCFAYDSITLIQDPQSHHSIVESYIPPEDHPEQWDPKNEAWKNWQCIGGPNAGESCDPTVPGECGDTSTCATRPTTSVGCTAYPNGPEDLGTLLGFFGRASTRQNIAVAQEATFREKYPDGVFGVIPVKGFIIWNSHSFNLTGFDTTVSQYINFQYVEEAERQFLREDLTVLDRIFAMGTIEPFTTGEACATFTLPVGARLLTLSSHTHQYGRDFRIWYPPNDPCAGSLTGSSEACEVPARDPDYRSFSYQDPLYQRFDDTNNLEILDSADTRDRTFRYCALWDNGATDPMAVRRHSERPDASTCAISEFTDLVGPCGCEPGLRACLGGPNQGVACNGDDTVCGDGGICDACPVWGGVTTEEEMFGILGAYYVAR